MNHNSRVSGKVISSWNEVFELLVIAIVYWVIVQLGLLQMTRPGGIAAVWPVSGFTLAILLFKPKHWWPVFLTIIFITNGFGNWSGGNSPLVSLGYAIANTIEPALGAWVMLSFCKSKITFETTREIIILFIVGTVVTALTASLGALVSFLAYHTTFLNTWFVWWTSDGLGIILITPFIIGWTTKGKAVTSMTWRQIVETSILVVIITVFTWLLYGPFTIAEKPLLRNYMLFPLLIWLAFLLGPRSVARVLLLVAIIATWNTLRGYGIFSFASQDQAEHLVSLQIFLVVETFSALLLSTIISERRKAETQKEDALQAMRASEGKYLDIFDDAPVGIFQSTPEGKYTLVNPAMANIYGYASPAEMIAVITDISKQIYVNPSDRLEFQHSLVQNGNLFEYIGKNYRKDRSIIWTQTTARVVKDTFGSTLYYEGFITDISGRIQAEALLKESEERFRSLLQNVQYIAVQGYGPDGTTQYWNKASEILYGYKEEEAIGRNLVDLIIPPEMREYVIQAIKQMAETGQPIPPARLSLMRKDCSRVAVYSSHAIVHVPGRLQELFCIDIDLTELQQIESQRVAALEALHESEKQFRVMFEKSAIGYTLTTINGEYINVNNAFADMLGYTVDELVGKNWVDITVPEYIAPNHNMLKPILMGQQNSATYEKRYLCKDGSTREAFISTTLLRDEEKNPRFFITNIIDITERKRVESQREEALEALRVSEQQFKLISELTSDYIYQIGISPEGKVSLDFVTDSYYEATGRDIEKTRTFESWVEIFHPEDLASAIQFMQNLISTHQPGKFECRTFRADKEIRWIEIVARPEWDERENRVTSIIGAVKDISDRKQAEIKLQYLSLHDALTGLNNRAFFEESMEHLEHGRQFPISVLMVDVDKLKYINDHFGHETGDKLLKRAGNLLIAAFRVEDVIARIGGDEFAVLLIGTSRPEAEAAMLRLRTILSELNAASDGPELQISCGLCTAEQGASLIETLKEADAKMYLEKQSRNLNYK